MKWGGAPCGGIGFDGGWGGVQKKSLNGAPMPLPLWETLLVGVGRGAVSLAHNVLYITSRFTYMNSFFLTTHSNFSVLNFKLGVPENDLLAWMFFFCTLATAFSTSYSMKNDFSCWVWKLSNDACPLNFVPSASFLTQSNWLENNADRSLCITKEALGTRLMPPKTMIRCYNISNV